MSHFCKCFGYILLFIKSAEKITQVWHFTLFDIGRCAVEFFGRSLLKSDINDHLSQKTLKNARLWVSVERGSAYECNCMPIPRRPVVSTNIQ